MSRPWAVVLCLGYQFIANPKLTDLPTVDQKRTLLAFAPVRLRDITSIVASDLEVAVGPVRWIVHDMTGEFAASARPICVAMATRVARPDIAWVPLGVNLEFDDVPPRDGELANDIIAKTCGYE
jgi:hypothetical protein